MYGIALFLLLVIFVIYVFRDKIGLNNMKYNNPIATVMNNITEYSKSHLDGYKEDQPFAMETNTDTTKITNMTNMTDVDAIDNQKHNIDENTYDPIAMGAVKQSEVNAHYKGLKERSPFSTVGALSAGRVKRDDDPYSRETGVPWVGGVPHRAFNRRVGGPQSGARDTVSASAKAINELHQSASNANVWVG
jgi:hypothetical protein